MIGCDIIIPVWNELDATRECIDSILKHTGDYPYRLIIIDNASDSKTSYYLNSLKNVNGLNVLLVLNKENQGFVKAVNQGIKISEMPYLCIMNNDTIATDGWLKKMAAVMDEYPDIGLLNPSSNTSGQFPGTGESIDSYALSLEHFKTEIQELYTCRGFCMLLRREVVENIGLLDEIYHLGYFDDTDYCKKAQAKGYRTARAKASYVYHKENTSFKNMSNNKDLFKDNERIFFRRWGRPLRVGYFAGGRDREDKINDIATNVARSGHQIVVFLKRGSIWPVRLDHFDIRKYETRPLLFWAASIYKILKSKKKKKLDVLVTDDAMFGNILKAMGSVHGSDVVINPEKDKLIALLAAKSQAFD